MIEIRLVNLFLLVGVVKLVSMAYEVLVFLKHFILTKEYDLAERYGKGTWALVTGSSDGIGAEYAKLLA